MPQLDLDLWLNQDLVKRQNRLKSEFLFLFESIGNHFENEFLQAVHPQSKGKKISKGNDLLGFPYQVLDLIRDFSPESGINIRYLNWFGHGFFLFLIFGHKHQRMKEQWLERGFSFSLSESPWDYPEMILQKKHTGKFSEIPGNEARLQVWFKPISIQSDFQINLNLLTEEIKKVAEILLLPLERKKE
ncbi:hypothetical protein Aconfl_24260 [Algoriphagus confluentis]|uniref:Uncharacterized protein n=2 Tax=Algoriphagus confluentis TaxID=1697556 RepID=A0ABQ6PRH2_9BACT|nr:hypothetical protein Aconfl_24260 [Algoriphagus confluentis]